MNTATTSEQTDVIQIPYPPELYCFDTTAEGISGGFPTVTEADIEYFHRHGYLVINDAFSATEVEDALAGMVHLMDGSVPISGRSNLNRKLAKQKDEMEGDERRNTIRKVFRFVDHEPRLNAMAAHSGLLGVLEQIMGDTPELFQDMALVKPPRFGSEKPWHQDCAILTFRKEQQLSVYGLP